MSQYLIDLAARVIIAVVMTIAAIIIAVCKNSKNEKIRKAATRISEVVETIYRDCTSTEKLQAFKQLCKEQHVNVKKAVDFLENYIIPSSKVINVCNPPKKNDGDDNNAGLA